MRTSSHPPTTPLCIADGFQVSFNLVCSYSHNNLNKLIQSWDFGKKTAWFLSCLFAETSGEMQSREWTQSFSSKAFFNDLDRHELIEKQFNWGFVFKNGIKLSDSWIYFLKLTSSEFIYSSSSVHSICHSKWSTSENLWHFFKLYLY